MFCEPEHGVPSFVDALDAPKRLQKNPQPVFLRIGE
jgi:hypothetical protein